MEFLSHSFNPSLLYATERSEWYCRFPSEQRRKTWNLDFVCYLWNNATRGDPFLELCRSTHDCDREKISITLSQSTFFVLESINSRRQRWKLSLQCDVHAWWRIQMLMVSSDRVNVIVIYASSPRRFSFGVNNYCAIETLLLAELWKPNDNCVSETWSSFSCWLDTSPKRRPTSKTSIRRCIKANLKES